MPFTALLREARLRRGWSLSELAESVHYDRGHISHVETGRRSATRDFVDRADRALSADGSLVRAWREEEATRQARSATRAALAASLAASRDLAALAELDLDQLQAGAEQIALDYLGTSPAPMLERANALRSDVIDRIRGARHTSRDQAELYVLAGRLSGVLAYAVLDLGEADAALEHARAAGRAAQYAGDDELLVWVRGTQSLIARFQGDYVGALDYVRDARQYVSAATGTGEARILCGEAQCLANLGQAAAAEGALREADAARDRIERSDSVGGLFGFSVAKQKYYGASSLMWLEGEGAALRAVADAQEAIALWQAMPADERSLDDERLAHVYQATALVSLGEVDRAVDVITPLFALAEVDRISWIAKRMGQLGTKLSEPRFAGSALAGQTVRTIRELAHAG